MRRKIDGSFLPGGPGAAPKALWNFNRISFFNLKCRKFIHFKGIERNKFCWEMRKNFHIEIKVKNVKGYLFWGRGWKLIFLSIFFIGKILIFFAKMFELFLSKFWIFRWKNFKFYVVNFFVKILNFLLIFRVFFKMKI